MGAPVSKWSLLSWFRGFLWYYEKKKKKKGNKRSVKNHRKLSTTVHLNGFEVLLNYQLFLCMYLLQRSYHYSISDEK